MVGWSADRGPDFVGIGAQKAGTTWLAHQLGLHPEIFVPNTKELHYLDWLDLGHPRSHRGRTMVETWHGRFYRRSAAEAWASVKRQRGEWTSAVRLLAYHFGPRSEATYRGVFPRSSSDLIRGEFTPDYGPVSAPSVETFLHTFPGVKIILVLRDPVERRWSNILHVLAATGHDPGTMTVDQLKSVLDNDNIGDYRSIIETWRRYVPAERFGLFFYDDLEADPGRFLDGVLAFLGLSPGWRSPTVYERVHVTGHLRAMPEEIRQWASADLRPLLDWLVDAFPYLDHPKRWREQAAESYQ